MIAVPSLQNLLRTATAKMAPPAPAVTMPGISGMQNPFLSFANPFATTMPGITSISPPLAAMMANPAAMVMPGLAGMTMSTQLLPLFQNIGINLPTPLPPPAEPAATTTAAAVTSGPVLAFEIPWGWN